MYKLRYDFRQYNNVIASYIEDLINKSSENFQSQKRSLQIREIQSDSMALASCFEFLEDYLYYNFKNCPSIFNNLLNKITDNVKVISLLPDQERGIYGKTETRTKSVYINPDLESKGLLTGEDRTRLYMAHELGHVINNSWMEKVLEFANQQLRLGRLTREHAQLIYDGFFMLDEATTQNRAENFTYEFSKKKRPEMDRYISKRLFNGEVYRFNFDFYGELQEPAIMFARTLKGIGKEDNDSICMDLLSQRAMKPDFFDKIYKEYVRDGQIPSFMEELKYMGYLKRASYANFGYGDSIYLKESGNYLSKLKLLTAKMRDYGDPIKEDFDK